jgi:acyl-CoA thioesterase FadM
MSEDPMNMQLDTIEVQAAVTEYLRKRGVVIDDARQVQLEIASASGARIQVQLEIASASGARISIAGYAPVVVAHNVTLPEGGPYR